MEVSVLLRKMCQEKNIQLKTAHVKTVKEVSFIILDAQRF
jgi:hypothetical protein